MPNIKKNQFRTFGASIKALERSADEESGRQFELSFSSEQPYERCFGTEILCHDDGAVNLERLNNVGTVLFHHGRDTSYGFLPIAKIISTEIKDGRGTAIIEFDDDEKSEVIYQKVKNGTLKGVSVGYSIDCYEEVKQGAKSSNGRFEGPCIVVTKWTPLEISIEPVPADTDVGIGRDGLDDDEPTLPPQGEKSQENGGQQMPNEISEQDIIKAQQQRTIAILNLCRTAGIEPDEYLQSEKSLEEIIGEVNQKSANKLPDPVPNITVGDNLADVEFAKSAVEGQLLRMGFGGEKSKETAKGAEHMSLKDLAVQCAARSGVANAQRMDITELLRTVLTQQERSLGAPPSAFQSIVNNTLNAVLLKSTELAPTTYEQWTGKGSNPNFKSSTKYRLSSAGNLVKVLPNGELKRDIMTDEGVSTKLQTFGKTFAFTRETIINDDLGVLAQMIKAHIVSVKRTINSTVYKLLASNETMIYDGNKLFDKTKHKNLGTAGKLSSATLTELIKLMALQTDISGTSPLNIVPKYLIVPMSLDTEARKLIYSDSDQGETNSGIINPHKNRFEIISDATLDSYSTTAFYGVADKNLVDSITVSYLNGQETPTLESSQSFNTLGIDYRLFLDFSVDVIDFRGLVKNDGK